MKIEEYLGNIITEYKNTLDKNSDIFEMESFNIDSKCILTKNEKQWFEDNYAISQLVYIPVKNTGQKYNTAEPLNVKYLQLENGLYISPKLFKFMNFYEAKRKRDTFKLVL